MTNLIKSSAKSVLLILATLLFAECCIKSNGKSVVLFSLQKVALKCDTTDSEMGRIIFELDITNNSSEPINLTEPESEKNASPQKCFLISDNAFPDALNLLIKSDPSGQTINSGKSGKIITVLEFDKLKETLARYANKNISFNDVRDFLNRKENYSIVYMSSKDTTCYWVSKSPKLQISCNYP